TPAPHVDRRSGNTLLPDLHLRLNWRAKGDDHHPCEPGGLRQLAVGHAWPDPCGPVPAHRVLRVLLGHSPAVPAAVAWCDGHTVQRKGDHGPDPPAAVGP